MEKLSRNARVAIITKILTENPNRILSLNYFADLFHAAKSTISEDLVIVRESLSRFGEGRIETLAGAAGGVKYVVAKNKESRQAFKEELLKYLSDPSRIVPGNFLYITDLMQNPRIVRQAGEILAEYFQNVHPDYIITVETKGIPLAYEVARYLGVSLIVVRRNTKITEGTAVSINYVTGKQGMLSVMSLSKRSLRPDSKLVFIDDFLRGGGTVRGIRDLLKEFDCTLAGIGIMVDNKEGDNKNELEHVNFCDYYGIDEKGNVDIRLSDSI